MKKSIIIASLILITFTVAYAGSLTPPGSVANTMYTLDDIYTKLTTNADATLGSGSIPSTPGSISSTFHTLTELYTAIPTIDATKVLTGTTYLGVAGSASAGYTYGDASATQVLTTATGAGTYNASNLSVGNVKAGIAFGVSSTGTLYSATTLATNQTLCYDQSGSTSNTTTCAGTGQDGELLKSVARSYTDNSDGTITDNSTGLVWQKCTKGLSGSTCATGSATTDSFTNALTYCNANTAGLAGSNWRLPNINELFTLVDFGVASAPFINTTYFPATQSTNYWSSTSRQGVLVNGLTVAFSTGLLSSTLKSTSGSTHIRCVRG